VLVLGLVVAIPHDAGRARARRQGRRLRGPELETPRTFTRRLRADGVGWMQARRRGLFSGSRSGWVRVAHAVESSHFPVMGDTGTGKSALWRVAGFPSTTKDTSSRRMLAVLPRDARQSTDGRFFCRQAMLSAEGTA
jgi:hypothetical protein